MSAKSLQSALIDSKTKLHDNQLRYLNISKQKDDYLSVISNLEVDNERLIKEIDSLKSKESLKAKQFNEKRDNVLELNQQAVLSVFQLLKSFNVEGIDLMLEEIKSVNNVDAIKVKLTQADKTKFLNTISIPKGTQKEMSFDSNVLFIKTNQKKDLLKTKKKNQIKSESSSAPSRPSRRGVGGQVEVPYEQIIHAATPNRSKEISENYITPIPLVISSHIDSMDD
jgi:hypothetical protein